MRRSTITGVGAYLPERVVTNDDLAERCNTSDAWVRERTGIERRHFAAPGETASTMGATAARRALESAQREVSDVDCIVFATLSPDHCFPGSGCLTQALLERPGVPAFDVRNQCSGFLYGLQMADAFVRQGLYRCVLVIGAEVHSTGLDFTPRGRDVAVLFGDGAAAVVVEPGDEAGILGVQLGADGRHARDLWCDGPSSAHHPERVTAEMLERGVQYPQMRGRKVFKHAVQRMDESVREIVAEHELSLDDIDLFVPHQANLRISDMVARRLGLDADRVFNNIQHRGNTTAASIPLALAECLEAGRVAHGDLVAIAAFGSGFTWGTALVRWSMAP